jgi:preprotein translocase subunit YajC
MKETIGVILVLAFCAAILYFGIYIPMQQREQCVRNGYQQTMGLGGVIYCVRISPNNNSVVEGIELK